MGRELRRVPIDWEHPKNSKGHFIPLLDEDILEVAETWEAENAHLPEERQENRPNPDDYRPRWPKDAVLGYAVYENTTEGTPITPTFPTKEELIEYLVTKGTYGKPEGWPREAAEKFVSYGYAPSMVIIGNRILTPESPGFYPKREF